MAKPGRKPKPTHLKLLTGTAQPSRINKNEPQPAQGERVPSCPAHLGGRAATEWKRIAKELHDLKILTRVDVKALAAYCEAYALWVQADGLLKDYNMKNSANANLLVTPTGVMKTHPYVDQLRQHRADMVKFAAEFGITPSSRARVNAPGAQGGGGEWDDF